MAAVMEYCNPGGLKPHRLDYPPPSQRAGVWTRSYGAKAEVAGPRAALLQAPGRLCPCLSSLACASFQPKLKSLPPLLLSSPLLP